MKPICLQFMAALAATFALGTGAACAQQGETSQEAQGSAAAILPVVEGAENWLDAPQTPGDWAYAAQGNETVAYFGDRDQPEERHFMIRCDRGTGQVWLARASRATEAVAMRIRTETRAEMLLAEPLPMTGLVAVSLPAHARLLDAMAVTKGRFAIEVEGMEPLYIPAWAEVTRVIEDCR